MPYISYASSLDIKDYLLLIAHVRNVQVININDDSVEFNRESLL